MKYKKWLHWCIYATFVFGLLHDVDHIFRHQSGWPVIPEFTPWTISLLIYPLVVIGLYLESKKKPMMKYWFVFFLLTFLLAAGTHLHLLPSGPPGHPSNDTFWGLMQIYHNPFIAIVALFVLLMLVISLLIGTYVSYKLAFGKKK